MIKTRFQTKNNLTDILHITTSTHTHTLILSEILAFVRHFYADAIYDAVCHFF